MKSLAAIGCLSLLLWACAEGTWKKPGMDEAELGTDLQQCQQKAVLTSRRLGLAPSLTQNPDLVTEQGFVSECMRSRGYRLEK